MSEVCEQMLGNRSAGISKVCLGDEMSHVDCKGTAESHPQKGWPWEDPDDPVAFSLQGRKDQISDYLQE